MTTTQRKQVFEHYDAAMRAEDFRAALNIAYANQDLFDWSGEHPDDWAGWQVEAAIELGIGAVAPQKWERKMQRKTSRPMQGNPSVEYMAGFFAWGRGQDRDADPYRTSDKTSSLRWQRGWSYAEAHRVEA